MLHLTPRNSTRNCVVVHPPPTIAFQGSVLPRESLQVLSPPTASCTPRARSPLQFKRCWRATRPPVAPFFSPFACPCSIAFFTNSVLLSRCGLCSPPSLALRVAGLARSARRLAVPRRRSARPISRHCRLRSASPTAGCPFLQSFLRARLPPSSPQPRLASSLFVPAPPTLPTTHTSGQSSPSPTHPRSSSLTILVCPSPLSTPSGAAAAARALPPHRLLSSPPQRAASQPGAPPGYGAPTIAKAISSRRHSMLSLMAAKYATYTVLLP